MKGMLVKDLRLILDQKVLIFIGIGCALLCLVMLKDPTFIIGYLTILAACMGAVTIAYDEMNNGRQYLFTLPCSREKYVLSKYIFAAALCIVTLTASTALCLGFNLIHRYDSAMNIILGAVEIMVPGLLIPAVMIPIALKFGHARSRIIVFIVIGFLIALSTAAALLDGVSFVVMEDEEIISFSVSSFEYTVGFFQALTIALIGTVTAFLASFGLSVGIAKKMQF